jgi:hypothetical protein
MGLDRPSAPAALVTSIATNGAMAFLIIISMTFGLILPRLLFERCCPRQYENGLNVPCIAAPFKKSRHTRPIYTKD